MFASASHTRTLLLGLLFYYIWMLRSISRPLRTLRTTSTTTRLPFVAPFNAARLAHTTRISPAEHLQHLQHLPISMTTVNHADAYKPNAPSPFVTAPGEALQHLLDGYQLVEAKDGLPAYAQFTKELEQSENDDREHR